MATRLAAAGAEVLLSVRNPAKGRAAIRNLLRAFRLLPLSPRYCGHTRVPAD
ncbi:hypothetical protein [Streptomyces sp. col6]|uniref:hypothetical protein n=1 Tax=Streptomyces sp. col6 TaxID=2478958 RepID=UPI0039901814